MRASTLAAAAALGIAAGISNAQILEYNFVINVAQEVPAPTIPMGFDPSGTGFVTLDLATNEITWDIEYQGLTGDIVAPGAHFHGPADFGATAGVRVFIAGGTGAPLPQPPSGRLMGSAIITPEQAQDLQDGLWYVNIHTALNQSGEIRGQVIPAPATAALLGLGGLAALRRRRSRVDVK